MHRLHRFPLAVIEQAVEILAGGVTLRLATEAGAEPIEALSQASQQRSRGPRRHTRSVPNLTKKYKPDLSIRPNQPDKVVLIIDDVIRRVHVQ
jgi:hypothetical protein